MRKIVRYVLKEGENRISMPFTSIVVMGGNVADEMSVWVETDTSEKENTDRVFFVVKEGGEIDEGMEVDWIGVAVPMNNDSFLIGEVL